MIDEVATSVGGDPARQFVEIRMLSNGQNGVAGTVVGAFDAAGGYRDVLIVPADVPRAGAGLRWLIATAALQSAYGAAPDFIVPPGILPVEDGMICWGAPGTTPPDPASWDHRDPTQYTDCVAYGRFCGDSPSGPPVRAAPVDHAIARTGARRFTDADFACSPTLTPQGDGGVEVTIAGTACADVGPAVCGRPLRGGGSPRTDCLASWVVPGRSRRQPVIHCRDGDACDRGTGPGCFVRVQVCFGAAVARRCTPAPVTAVALLEKPRTQLDRGNADQIVRAIAALGGQVDAAAVAFTPPLAVPACTSPFGLLVPTENGAAHERPGARTFTLATDAGRHDRDRIRIVCSP